MVCQRLWPVIKVKWSPEELDMHGFSGDYPSQGRFQVFNGSLSWNWTWRTTCCGMSKIMTSHQGKIVTRRTRFSDENLSSDKPKVFDNPLSWDRMKSSTSWIKALRRRLRVVAMKKSSRCYYRCSGRTGCSCNNPFYSGAEAFNDPVSQHHNLPEVPGAPQRRWLLIVKKSSLLAETLWNN